MKVKGRGGSVLSGGHVGGVCDDIDEDHLHSNDAIDEEHKGNQESNIRERLRYKKVFIHNYDHIVSNMWIAKDKTDPRVACFHQNNCF